MVTAEDDNETVTPGEVGASGAFAGDDAPLGPRVGVLLVRAWIEPGTPTVRARLLTTEDDSPVPTTWATAAGNEAICEEFLRWLEHLQERAGPPDV